MAVELEVDDVVEGNTYGALRCGAGAYKYAIVVSTDPFVLASAEGRMLWTTKNKGDVKLAESIAVDKDLVRAKSRFARYLGGD